MRRSRGVVRHRNARTAGSAGFTLIEVTISAVVLAFLMMASSSAFVGNLRGVSESRRTAEAAVFLETTCENVAAQPYDNLLSLNGSRVYDGLTAASSQYALDLAAFQSQVDLIQVTAVLVDLRSGREVSRSVMLRSNR